MTTEDRTRFCDAFDMLVSAFQKSYYGTSREARAQARIHDQGVYFRALEGFAVGDVVVAACQLAEEGTPSGRSGRLPLASEWVTRTRDVAAERLLEEGAAARLLPEPVDPATRARDLEAAQRARDAFVEQLLAKGAKGLAKVIMATPLRHPSEDEERAHCSRCGDTGRRQVGGAHYQPGSELCDCLPTNPVIRARAEHQRVLSPAARRRATGRPALPEAAPQRLIG